LGTIVSYEKPLLEPDPIAGYNQTEKGPGISRNRGGRKPFAPAGVKIAMLANSFLYQLGLTMVIDFGNYKRLVSFFPGEQDLLINKTVPSMDAAIEHMYIYLLSTDPALYRLMEPQWTLFYQPEQTWWEEKYRVFLALNRRTGK